MSFFFWIVALSQIMFVCLLWRHVKSHCDVNLGFVFETVLSVKLQSIVTDYRIYCDKTVDRHFLVSLFGI